MNLQQISALEKFITQQSFERIQLTGFEKFRNQVLTTKFDLDWNLPKFQMQPTCKTIPQLKAI
jgi:hypothetical protein